MKTNTRDNIYKYIINNAPVSINDIKLEFWISREMIHRHINKLLNEAKVYKVWTAPKVFYFADQAVNIPILGHTDEPINIDKDFFDINNFAFFGADWETKFWKDWFISWCKKRKLDINKEFSIYEKTIRKYDKFKTKYWLIKWIDKMKSTFYKTYLDKVYYLDFYSIEKYWKTYLWNLMFYAKQTWDTELAERVIDEIKAPIYNLIRIKNIDSFAFIPPSIDRKIQLMDELKEWLWIDLKELKLIKLFRDKVVAQKSLNKKIDRIENARDTIFILDKKFKSDTILLIDDAVWSWATLNETAKKIKEKWFAKRVIWLAIVWSYKWFEVINEV
jgi:hypothetical protein